MDEFSRYNQRAIDDRHVDTLIGLAKGLVADDVVNQAEVESLLCWLVQARENTSHPMVINLRARVEVFLQDRSLDKAEATELLGVLRALSGGPTEMGEFPRATSLPIDKPLPNVAFSGRTFLFTGTCAFGSRKQCEVATESLGGKNVTGVTKSLNYLVIGSYVTDSWAHETFGRKIEKAMEYRQQGVPIAIITEEHWANCGGFMNPSTLRLVPA